MNKPNASHASDSKTGAKKAAAKVAVELIQDGMCIGLGTGSTALHFIAFLGEKCREGLQIKAVATSAQSHDKALSEGIPVVDVNTLTTLDLTVDGADEVDREKRMIKGGGGALFREKVVAAMSQDYVIIVDESKVVESLGKFPLPIEISPFGHPATLAQLEEKGYFGQLRTQEGRDLFLTENGNYIADVKLPYPCTEPEKEDIRIKKIPGVLETGLFYGMVRRVFVGYGDGHCDFFE